MTENYRMKLENERMEHQYKLEVYSLQKEAAAFKIMKLRKELNINSTGNESV